MSEMNQRRNNGMGLTSYSTQNDIVDDFYAPGSDKKHKSPTRRLIKHKNSTWEHKARIQTNIAKGEYSQTYCISPGKTYVIEAQGGELPYELAEKSPTRFYNQVLNQDVVKYSVKMRGNITGEWTQRPLLKIIMSIKERIIRKIGENIGEQFEQDIVDALATGGEVEEKLIEMVQNEQIDLVDGNNNLLIQQQRSALQEDNDRASSPDARKLDAAELKIKEA